MKTWFVLVAFLPLVACKVEDSSDDQNGHTQAGAAGAEGDGGDGNGGNGGTSDVDTRDCENPGARLCASGLDRQERCGDLEASERATQEAECVAEVDPAHALSCVFIDSYTTCLDQLDCDTSDDTCMTEGFLAAEPEGWDVALLRECIAGTVTDAVRCEAAIGGSTTTCLDRRQECIDQSSDSSSPFTDDRCFSLAALTDEAVQTALECLPLACDQIEDCLEQAGTFTY